jgi:hypothetical protein
VLPYPPAEFSEPARAPVPNLLTKPPNAAGPVSLAIGRSQLQQGTITVKNKPTHLHEDQVLELWGMNQRILKILREVKANRTAARGDREMCFLWHLNDFTESILLQLMRRINEQKIARSTS